MLFQAGYALFSPADAVVSLKTSEVAWYHSILGAYLASLMSGMMFEPAMPWLQALENRTLDSKREMDIMNALDEMKSLKSRQEKVDSNALLDALQRSADDDRAALAAEDEAAVR